MKSKTDKRSSLDHVMHYIDRKAEFGKTIPVEKAKRAAQYAFSAGRESVVENMPKLSWSSVGPEKMSNPTLVGVYIITPLNPSFKLELNNGFVSRIVDCPFKTKKEAIQSANEDYKKRIKQALGL